MFLHFSRRATQIKHWFSSGIQTQTISTVAQIVQKKAINHDSYIYKLKFIQRPFHLAIGQHFRIVERIKTYDSAEEQEVVRKYTPINPCSQTDVMDVLFKIYRPNANIAFPNGGKLTPYIESLKQGDKIHLEGPLGKFGYQPGGKFTLNGQQRIFKRIFFMAGGSGITPCFQVIREIAAMPNETIELVLLFANKTEADILLRQELDKLSNRAKIVYSLDLPPPNWSGLSGIPTQQTLQSIFPLNDPQTLYIHCGPFAMNSFIRELFSKKYSKSKLFKF